jgi:hypothetical protein
MGNCHKSQVGAKLVRALKILQFFGLTANYVNEIDP